MNNRQKALNLLGLAQRAGLLVTGEEMVLEAVKSKKAKIIIVASDSSQRSIKQFKNKCETYNVNLNLDYSSEEISHAIGKERKSCAIINHGFAESFMQLH